MTSEPETMGVDTPDPPRSARQATLSEWLNTAGRLVSGLTPFPPGPRQ